MNPRATRIIHLVLWLTLLCSNLSIIVAQDDVNPSEPTVVVTAIEEGSARIRFANGFEQVLTVGTSIRLDDVIILEGGLSVVWLLCPDLSEDIVTETRVPNCARTQARIIYVNGVMVRDTQQRPLDQSNVLYMIFPRSSRLLSPSPSFRWTAVNGADSYTITVQTIANREIWKQAGITTTSITYPANAAPLRAFDEAGEEIRYLVKVEAFGANGIEVDYVPDPRSQQALTVASPTEREQFLTEVNRLENLSLPITTKVKVLAFLRAQALYHAGYYADALALVEPLLPVALTVDLSSDTIAPFLWDSSPHLYALLGDLYAAIDLPVEAELSYMRMLQVSELLEDLAMQASAHARLIPFAADRRERAVRIDTALMLFDQIGDQNRVCQLNELFNVGECSR